MKKINASFLRHFAIIDTPGMLDSITKRDRGYDYLQVVGDLAHLADLVLVLFDPHKAGTIREAHISLRDTLPAHTFEHRIFYVLNRIDECASLADLLRVYGTLCWNLSQITGRKDIPPIRLTYSQHAAEQAHTLQKGASEYLDHLNNQREELKTVLMQAPKYHLDLPGDAQQPADASSGGAAGLSTQSKRSARSFSDNRFPSQFAGRRGNNFTTIDQRFTIDAGFAVPVRRGRQCCFFHPLGRFHPPILSVPLSSTADEKCGRSDPA